MREVISFMVLMEEAYFILKINIPRPEVFCKIFTDNQSCIVVADSNKFPLKTKHIAIKYHHFLSFVKKNIIWICYIDTR